MTQRISAALNLRGPYNFQAMLDGERRPKVTEVNARLAGTCNPQGSFIEGDFDEATTLRFLTDMD